MSDIVTTYKLFGGQVRNISTTLGLNSNPTVATIGIVEDGQIVDITNRRPVDITIGEFKFRGIVQSWSEAKTDVNGTGIYQIRVTDMKPVLDAAQVIIGSSFDETFTIAKDYGDNIISVLPENALQISNGIPFNIIKSYVENAVIKYGNQKYTVNFNFTLPTRGSKIEYTIRHRAMSLLELISQVANDHGLDWYVSTSTNNVIAINMFGRTNITNVTINQLAALHQGKIIRRHEGDENRDTVQKAILLGGFKSHLKETAGFLWRQFWGYDENEVERSQPMFTKAVMEKIINNDFTSEEYTEEDVQKILSYANEFWGRKFIALMTPVDVIGPDGRSWIVPTSAAWNDSKFTPTNDPEFLPVDFDRNLGLKFQTDDGRWVTFATLPLPGIRSDFGIGGTTYQWDDELFSNPNTYINKNRDISIKASLEIVDGFTEIEFLLDQFIIHILNLEVFNSVSFALTSFFLIHPQDVSFSVNFNFTRMINNNANDVEAIAKGELFYTDDIKNKFRKDFKDQYYVLTLSSPLRVKQIKNITTTNPDTGRDETVKTITKTRVEKINKAFLALLDQRETYGPWSNRLNTIGKTEVIIDSSLTPWLFGFRGITNDTGLSLLDDVAHAKIKTVTDTTMDAKTAELEVAGVPAINIGDQLQTTGIITSMQIVFGINGVRTTYKSSQYTTELSRHLRQQQDLLDRLRRQNSEFNNTMKPPKDDWELDRTIRALKKELPEPPVDVSTEGNRRQSKNLLGRIDSRSSDTEPKYNITPMAWIGDVFGSLTLRRDPNVFGDYLDVINMGESPNIGGRLQAGTDVRVFEFAVTDGGIVSYYIDTPAPKSRSFSATIDLLVSTTNPVYKVTPISNNVQQINLTANELLSLNSVTNLGEPANSKGFLSPGTQVIINWNENDDGSFTPFMEQQLNLFKPI